MKIWGIAATLGFAVLAFVFGLAVGNDAMTAALGADPSRSAYDGAAVAVSLLVGNPVQIVTLGLAARLTGEDHEPGGRHPGDAARQRNWHDR